jgi:hypothetical protein
MTVITNFAELMKLERARRQPNLPFLAFSVTGMLDDIHARLFPDVTHSVRVKFVTRGPLACIAHDEHQATVYIHQLLNHHETPREVISTIIKHELLHLRIPTATVAGKEIQHPAEFWDAELAIAPERQLAWLWIYINFPCHVKRRPRLERFEVLPGWRQAWCSRRNSIEDCQKLAPSRTVNSGDIW